ncbi:MAG: transketolase, partial [Rhizobiales bacterium]|nr:transketolase [Hyphomicrobiales bacterium]
DCPSILALSRQNLPTLRSDASENLCVKGAYVLKKEAKQLDVILISTGSEVAIAMKVAEKLEANGHGARVVSMPCTELFDEQNASYHAQLLGNEEVLRVSIEAGSTFGWERYVGRDGLRFGIDSFGASAPIADLYAHFGLTSDAIVPQIANKLNA